MITLADIREGSTVIVRGGFGRDAPITAKIIEVLEEIKNGCASIDYVDDKGINRWAYLHQIDRVVEF